MMDDIKAAAAAGAANHRASMQYTNDIKAIDNEEELKRLLKQN
jgi:hypothetical protein